MKLALIVLINSSVTCVSFFYYHTYISLIHIYVVCYVPDTKNMVVLKFTRVRDLDISYGPLFTHYIKFIRN